MEHAWFDGRFAGFGVIVALSLLSANARAEDAGPTTGAVSVGSPTEPQLRFDAFASRLFSTPSMSFGEDPTRRSRVLEGAFPASNGVSFAGVGMSLGFTLADHWVVPCLGVDYASAIGPSDRLVTSLDGSLAELRPWTSRKLDLWVLGLGYRMKHRRWMVEFSIEPGFVTMWTNGGIASGATVTGLRANDYAFAARASVEVCRRLDPTDRVCLFAAPSLYEFGPLNGGSLGLRWELGP